MTARRFEPTTTYFKNEHPTSLAKWLSVRLRTKWLLVRILLLSLKLQIWRLLRARNSLTFRQTIEPGFTLKLIHDMIITYSQYVHLIKKVMLIFKSWTLSHPTKFRLVLGRATKVFKTNAKIKFQIKYNQNKL